MKKSKIVWLVLVILVCGIILTACSKPAVKIKDGTLTLKDAEITFGQNNVTDESKTTMAAVTVTEKPDGLLSTLYKLDLDTECKEPVAIKIQLPADTASDIPIMIGLGTEVKNPDGKTVISYHYIDATVKDGFVETSFIPAEYAAAVTPEGSAWDRFWGTAYAAPSNYRVYVGIFECMAYYKEGGHFRIHYPGVARFSDGEMLLQDLEGLYETFLTDGYAYSGRTVWPMEVNIVAMDDVGAYEESGLKNLLSGRSPDHGCISIRKDLFVSGYNQSTVKPILAHEWFHFIQANYTAAGNQSDWFDDATATYFEGKVRGGTPGIVDEYWPKAYSGVYPDPDTAQDGYARMPEIKYLVSQYTEAFILNALTNMKTGMNAKDAIIAATGDPAAWAANCYQDLTSGKGWNQGPYTFYSNLVQGNDPYTQIGTSMDLSLPSPEEIAASSEAGEPVILGETSIEVDAFGAKLVALKFDDKTVQSMQDGMKLNIKADAGTNVRVYAIVGSKFQITQGTEEGIMLENVKKSLDSKTQYLVLITGLQPSGKATYHVSVELTMFPTLDELVGNYDDGKVLVEKVFVSDALKAEAQAAATDANSNSDSVSGLEGCDIDVIKSFEEMQGKENAALLTIEKTGEDTGNLIITGEDGAKTPFPFTYKNGCITIDAPMSAASDGSTTFACKGTINCSYGPNMDVVIKGPLRFTLSVRPDDFYIDEVFTGTKPLPPKP